jgi:hypothetical protein
MREEEEQRQLFLNGGKVEKKKRGRKPKSRDSTGSVLGSNNTQRSGNFTHKKPKLDVGVDIADPGSANGSGYENYSSDDGSPPRSETEAAISRQNRYLGFGTALVVT